MLPRQTPVFPILSGVFQDVHYIDVNVMLRWLADVILLDTDDDDDDDIDGCTESHNPKISTRINTTAIKIV